MLPVVEPDGRVTAQQIVVCTLLLVPVSLVPARGMSGGLLLRAPSYSACCSSRAVIAAAFTHSSQRARRLLLASVVYLPVLFGLMVIDK